ncbi:MAG: PQQ-like beta-propeller repeat protein [Chthoniobacter sp.]|nr:PQQ-like beta-propeller repeat protein [Chthoniobacter sp.]
MNKLRPIALSTFALFHLSVIAGETEWPQFRGPTGQGLSAAVQVPVEWSAAKQVKWKVAIPGRGWSSPVLSRGRLYLTSAVGDSATTLHALCLDVADGRVLWDTEVFRPDPASVAAMHKKNSPASGSPIVTADRLYVHFGHMGTAALDLDGKVVWRQNELKYAPVHGNGGSPALAGGALVFSCDGAKDPFVAALDAATGALRWKTARNTPAKKPFSFCTPLVIEVHGATQVILPGSGFVGSYDLQDGREIWRVGYGEGYSVVPRPVFAHGLLFVSSGFDAPVLQAIKPDGATGDATATNIAWSNRKGAPLSASPLVLGDELYFVSDAGVATCANARTGEVHWSERLGGNFSASPVAAEERVYFLNEVGVAYVVKAGKSYELLATNDLGERTFASPAVADGALYLRTEKHLWKIAP